MRRQIIIGIPLIFITIGSVNAQNYPNRPIRFISPYAPGGGTDIIARALAQKLTESLGQSVIVDNRPGGGGVAGFQLVAKSPPDGYMILLGSTGPLTVNPNLGMRLPYDPIRDFAPITLTSKIPVVLAVHPSLPVKSVRELIAFAKARPGTLGYSSGGIGGSGHRGGAMFSVMAGVKMIHVAYRGTGPATIAVMSGEVPLTFGNMLSVLPHVKGGRLRAIAVTSDKRSPSAPELPTISESGLPGYEADPWYGVLAPAGTPREVIGRLHAELVKIMHHPDMREKLLIEGGEAVANSPEEFASHIKNELGRWARIVKEANLKPD
ncbi:MAG: tripartite tricarboxylate transporter substrate binding protein [Betaproteobacteria bacterium]|nr:tripartite tricarboxylate transporter substrate binding protein [Betaproteobacteria bacterium]